MSNPNEKSPSVPVAGVMFEWVLAQQARTYEKNGSERCVVELRDPARLGNSLVVFLDGPAGPLAAVSPHTTIALRVDEVRGGRGRGELIGSVSRRVVERAFAEAQRP